MPIAARHWIGNALGQEAVGSPFAAVSTALDKVGPLSAFPQDRVFGSGTGSAGAYCVVVGHRPADHGGDRPLGLPQPAGGRGHSMDRHFEEAALASNLPVLLGLVG